MEQSSRFRAWKERERGGSWEPAAGFERSVKEKTSKPEQGKDFAIGERQQGMVQNSLGAASCGFLSRVRAELSQAARPSLSPLCS